MLTTLRALASEPVRRWAVSSQHGARRNAMLSATECATRRALRDDVNAYLHTRLDATLRSGHPVTPALGRLAAHS